MLSKDIKITANCHENICVHAGTNLDQHLSGVRIREKQDSNIDIQIKSLQHFKGIELFDCQKSCISTDFLRFIGEF